MSERIADRLKADVYFKQWNKIGEELCGDTVKVVKNHSSCSVVLSDGLGSGVKANILSTLTAEIISTMLKEGAPLFDTVETVIKTLPIDEERKIAYSTFTIIQVHDNGQAYLVNYDNPSPVIIKNLVASEQEPEEKTMLGRRLLIYHFQLGADDFVYLMSDGVLYAGLGKLLNLGWGHEHARSYLEKITRKHKKVKPVVDNVMDLVYSYYGGECGDDATLVGIQVKKIQKVVIFTGPPLDPRDDEKVVKKFMKMKGTRVICGGTTSNIVSRITGNTVEIDIQKVNSDLPPVGKMKDVALVTEGVLTLTRTFEYLKKCGGDEELLPPKNLNGASQLAHILMDADECHFIVGRRLNPFYQNPNLPSSISIRKNMVERIVELLKQMGKRVGIEYV